MSAGETGYILIVTGSVRPNSVNEKIVEAVTNSLEVINVPMRIASLKVLNLPFFNDEYSPLNPKFNPEDKNVLKWTQYVAEAAKIIFIMPEYNHTITPVQLNAIDWVGKEWKDKPVAFVSYGWAGGKRAVATAHEVLLTTLKAKEIAPPVHLFFEEDLNTDGSFIEEEKVRKKIAQLTNVLTQ